MSIGNALRLITPLLLAALSVLASPAQAVDFGPVVNVSHDRKDSGGFSNQMAASGPNVYVVWSEGPFLFSRSTDGGTTYGPVTTLFSGEANASSGMAASGSNVYVSRSERLKPRATPQVFFRRSIDGGATFASQVQLSGSSGGTFAGIAASGNNVYVLWGATSGVNLSRSIDGGASFDMPVNLSNTTGQKHDAKVLADGSNVYVAWTEDGVGIVFGASPDSGANFGGLINIAPGYFAALATSGLNVYVAYDLGISGASDGNIFVAQSTDGGLTFGHPTDVSGAPAVNPPHITANGSDVHLVWQSSYPPGGPYDVLYAHSTDAGASYSLQTMSHSAAQFTGVVAANGSNVYVSWSEGGDILLAHSGNSGDTFDDTVNVSNVSGTSGASKQVATVATLTGIQHSWVDYTSGNSGNWDTFCRAGTP